MGDSFFVSSSVVVADRSTLSSVVDRSASSSRDTAAPLTAMIFELSKRHLKNGDNKNRNVGGGKKSDNKNSDNSNKFLHHKTNCCEELSDMPLDVWLGITMPSTM